MTSAISSSLARPLQERFRERQQQIIGLARALVEAESPSEDEAGSRQVVDLLTRAAEESSCVNSIERVNVPKLGQHLVIRAFQTKADLGNIFLVGHTDTVHPRGSLAERPWRVEANRIYGPGIYDMKANCALAVGVLHALDDLGIVPGYGVTLALTCDEEIGSFSGWPLLESLIQSNNTRCALVLEPPALGGSVKTGRKGTAIFEMKVEGRAAHAGLEPQKGASAILEVAKQIERLHAMNNTGRGINVNVGVVKGGTRSNVVAAEASAGIDVRFSSAAEAGEVEEALRNSSPFDERVRIT